MQGRRWLTAMQRIVVCAQDPVLAKKVRFLMERDECKVEILSSPGDLEGRLREAQPNLVILSRELSEEDAIDRIASLDAGLDLPPTLVLGGVPRITADFIHLVPDPVDTQAIYREATRMLQDEQPPPQKPPGPSTDESPKLDALEDEDLGLSREEALDGIADELNALESGQLEDSLTKTFKLEEEQDDVMEDEMQRYAPPSKRTPPESADQLDAAAFARALHEMWAAKEGGALIIDRREEQTTIHFEDGRPIAVSFSHRGDPLGRSLVNRGRLDQQKYAEAAIRSVENGIPLSASVIELGFISEEDLGQELGTSAKEALVAAFSASDGLFWKDPELEHQSVDRPYRLEVGHIIAQGIRAHADQDVVNSILGEEMSGYFRLKRPSYELQKDFPLSQTDIQFLSYQGRAYNLEDAADSANLTPNEARQLIAILRVCDEIEPFVPGPAEFEARIREERETRRELESQVPRAPSLAEAAKEEEEIPDIVPSFNILQETEVEPDEDEDANFAVEPPTAGRPLAIPSFPNFPKETTEPVAAAPIPAAPPPPAAAPPPMPSMRPQNGSIAKAAPPIPEADIPPMPVPSVGEGVIPRPLAYAKPLPRAPDGGLLDTPERAISREHFQNGVNLLGKGNFSSAEEHFRDAVALCSEEHVYLIGLARAIYYNPNYRAEGKVPILRNIVDRATQLAPDDKRVSTLEAWVGHAEALHP